MFFPPSSTSTLQPLDAHIIAALEKLKRLQFEDALGVISGNVPPNKKYYIDQLTSTEKS